MKAVTSLCAFVLLMICSQGTCLECKNTGPMVPERNLDWSDTSSCSEVTHVCLVRLAIDGFNVTGCALPSECADVCDSYKDGEGRLEPGSGMKSNLFYYNLPEGFEDSDQEFSDCKTACCDETCFQTTPIQITTPNQAPQIALSFAWISVSTVLSILATVK